MRDQTIVAPIAELNNQATEAAAVSSSCREAKHDNEHEGCGGAGFFAIEPKNRTPPRRLHTYQFRLPVRSGLPSGSPIPGGPTTNLVMDNLNTHRRKSLSKEQSAAAHRLAHPSPAAPVASASDSILTNPNTLQKASVATLRWRSASARNAVWLPFGNCVRLRRNPQYTL